MEGKQQDVSARNYEDFEPLFDRSSEADCDTILLSLPGFRKDQLSVKLIHATRTLKISGERQLRNNKWSRFVKEFTIPEQFNVNKITAMFTDGILHVKLPQMITPEGKEKPSSEAPKPQKLPKDEPKPPQQTDQDQQDTTQKSSTSMTEKNTKGLENGENVPEKEPENKGMSKQLADENGTFTPRKTSYCSECENFGGTVEDAATKIDQSGVPNNVEDGGKIGGENSEQRIAGLKRSRKSMNLVLLILMALVLGIYVKNWIVSSKKS